MPAPNKPVNDIIRGLERFLARAIERKASEKTINELTYRLWTAERYAKLTTYHVVKPKELKREETNRESK